MRRDILFSFWDADLDCNIVYWRTSKGYCYRQLCWADHSSSPIFRISETVFARAYCYYHSRKEVI